MNRLEKALKLFDTTANDELLIHYLRTSTADRILEDADDIKISVAYEDIMSLSVYALADLIIDSYNDIEE